MSLQTSKFGKPNAWRSIATWTLTLLLILVTNATRMSVNCRIWFYSMKSRWGELNHISTLVAESGVVTVTKRHYGRNGRQDFVVFLYRHGLFQSEFHLTRLIKPETTPDSPGYFASEDEPDWKIEADPISEYLCSGKTKLLRLR